MCEDAHVGRIRTLIVDDEQHARAIIRGLLNVDDDVEVVGESYGDHAPDAVGELHPDLMFLDVQMPRMDGFEVLAAIDAERMPVVVFTTAYDEYAVRAFEHAAIDYLLKPFSDRRFFRALARAKDVFRKDETAVAQRRLLRLLAGSLDRDHTQVTALPSGVHNSPSAAGRLVLRDGGRILIFPLSDIVWIEASGAYVRVHTIRGEALVRESLSSVEARLDRSSYFRVHRSAIVNLQHVQELRPVSHGDCTIILRNKVELKLSRTRREEFEVWLERGSS
jgi:two-component system LytT family response regulator